MNGLTSHIRSSSPSRCGRSSLSCVAVRVTRAIAWSVHSPARHAYARRSSLDQDHCEWRLRCPPEHGVRVRSGALINLPAAGSGG